MEGITITSENAEELYRSGLEGLKNMYVPTPEEFQEAWDKRHELLELPYYCYASLVRAGNAEKTKRVKREKSKK